MVSRYNPNGPYPLLLEVGGARGARGDDQPAVGPTYAPFLAKDQKLDIPGISTLFELFR